MANNSLQAVQRGEPEPPPQLLTVIEGLPDEVRIERTGPAFCLVWVDDKRFLAGEFFDHFHDDHEPDARAWLARDEKHADYRH